MQQKLPTQVVKPLEFVNDEEKIALPSSLNSEKVVVGESFDYKHEKINNSQQVQQSQQQDVSSNIPGTSNQQPIRLTPPHMQKLPKHLREEWVVNPRLQNQNLQSIQYQVPLYYVSAMNPPLFNQPSWPTSSPIMFGYPQQLFGGGHPE